MRQELTTFIRKNMPRYFPNVYGTAIHNQFTDGWKAQVCAGAKREIQIVDGIFRFTFKVGLP